jgi:hypothetical protein
MNFSRGGLFPNYTKQQGYENMNSSGKKSAHIYINAASSTESGYQKPTNSTGLPSWWKI